MHEKQLCFGVRSYVVCKAEVDPIMQAGYGEAVGMHQVIFS